MRIVKRGIVESAPSGNFTCDKCGSVLEISGEDLKTRIEVVEDNRHEEIWTPCVFLDCPVCGKNFFEGEDGGCIPTIIKKEAIREAVRIKCAAEEGMEHYLCAACGNSEKRVKPEINSEKVDLCGRCFDEYQFIWIAQCVSVTPDFNNFIAWKQKKLEVDFDKRRCRHARGRKTYYGPKKNENLDTVHGWYWECPDCGLKDEWEEVLS